MNVIETIDELKEVLAANTDGVDFSCSWNCGVSTSNLSADPDKTLSLEKRDRHEDDTYLGEITVDLARELMSQRLMCFDDISWDNNEVYMYSLKYEKILKLGE